MQPAAVKHHDFFVSRKRRNCLFFSLFLHFRSFRLVVVIIMYTFIEGCTAFQYPHMFKSVLHQNSCRIVGTNANRAIGNNDLVSVKFFHPFSQFPERDMVRIRDLVYHTLNFFRNIQNGIRILLCLICAQRIQFTAADEMNQTSDHVFCNKSQHINRIFC